MLWLCAVRGVRGSWVQFGSVWIRYLCRDVWVYFVKKMSCTPRASNSHKPLEVCFQTVEIEKTLMIIKFVSSSSFQYAIKGENSSMDLLNSTNLFWSSEFRIEMVGFNLQTSRRRTASQTSATDDAPTNSTAHNSNK